MENSKLGVYSVYDNELQIFNTPFYQDNDILAKRAFISIVSDKNSGISKFPDKFSLFHIGLFDQETGEHLQIKHQKMLTAEGVLKNE